LKIFRGNRRNYK